MGADDRHSFTLHRPGILVVEGPDSTHPQYPLEDTQHADKSLQENGSASIEESFSTDVADLATIPFRETHAADARPAGLQVGSHFGRYRVERVLGSGGMGSVFLATDQQLERRVALKTPHIAAAGSELIDRFFREAKAAATLNHPNICPVHDVGMIDGTYYLSMAYVQGTPLSELIPKQGLAIEKAVRIVGKLCEALQEAHDAGIIHRDLKPSNVMINERNEPVIMDFGLARREERDTKITQTGMAMGTPAYMAPEQVRGIPHEMGPATDLYQVGVILYEMLTGRLPFKGDSIAVIAQILSDSPPSPSEIRATVPRGLDAICLKAMRKDPVERYRSMRELAAALESFSRGEELPDVTLPSEGKLTTTQDTPKSATPIFAKIQEYEGAVADSMDTLHGPASADHDGTHHNSRQVLLVVAMAILTLALIAWAAS